MITTIGLLVTTLVLSLAIAYAMWIRVRVWILRQDLYAIRDDLWYAMRDKGLLDSEDHRRLRRSIEGLIRLAPRMSIWTMRALAKLPASEDPTHEYTIPEVIKAQKTVGDRVARYITFQTVSGFGFTWFCLIRHKQRQLSRQVAVTADESRRAMDTREVQTIDWDTPNRRQSLAT